MEGIKTLGRDVSLSVSSLSLMAKTSFSKSILWLAVFRIYIIRKTTVPYRKNSLRWEPFPVVLGLLKTVSFKWVS